MRLAYACVVTLLVSVFVQPAFATDEETVVKIYQKDFKYGTYIIDKPGKYKLMEDISFNPNSPATLTEAINTGKIPFPVAGALGWDEFPIDAYQAGNPLPMQFDGSGVLGNFTPGGPMDPRYNPAAFGLGFFAAIVIAADGVDLNLNNKKLEQSEEHALLQRFFALIELAEQPFIPNQGPADFGSDIVSAKNVTIRKGILGRSAHHGIHGNGNVNVRIKNVDFIDYEVAAVALNGVEGLEIINSNVSNRKDVPVLGTFSSVRFIKPYVDALWRIGYPKTLNVGGQPLTVTDIRNGIKSAVNNVHHDLIVQRHLNIVDGRPQINKNDHPSEYALFHNPFGVVDGNSYSFLVNNLGVAVNGFPTQPADGNDSNFASDIFIKNVHVNGQHAFINEIVALNQNGKEVIDPIGAVFQTRNLHPDTGLPITMTSLDPATAQYVGNVAANAQAFVAMAILDPSNPFNGSHLDLKRNNITQEVLNWVEAIPGFETLDSIVKSGADYFCNGDSMFHVNKGVIGFKMDAARSVTLKNTSVQDLRNFGQEGSSVCGDYLGGKSHPLASQLGYGGAKTRAYTLAGSKDVEIIKGEVAMVEASRGSVIGIDTFDSQDVLIKKSNINSVEAGLKAGPSYATPNETPTAVGVLVGLGSKNVDITKSCSSDLNGAAGDIRFKLDSVDGVTVRKECK